MTALLLLLAGTFFVVPLHGITIHFGDFPEGTLVSANNPYGSYLNIQASGGAVYQDFNTNSGFVIPAEARIRNGVLAVIPGELLFPATPPGVSLVNFYSFLTANFLVPVRDVSFSVFTQRHGGYNYGGTNDLGGTAGGSGLTAPDFSQQPGDWLTINLTLPTGYHLNEFSVSNRDFSPFNGSFWIQDISFTPVSDASDTLALLLTSCFGLIVVAKWTAGRLQPSR